MKKTFGSRVMDKPEGMLRPIFFPALTFMDVFTGDRRKLLSEGGGTRDLPQTIWAQFEQGPGGHVGAVIVGALHELTFDDDGVVSGSGWVLDDDNGRKLVTYAQTQSLRGNSADLADVKAQYEWDEAADDIAIVFSEWNIAGTTIVGRPAFKDASYTLDEPELVASWMADTSPLVIDLPTKINVLSAAPELTADATKRPAWDLFHQEEPDVAQPLRIAEEPDERGYYAVSAHLALWNSCHDGMESCIIPPRPLDNYAGFNSATVLTDKGLVATGPLFLRGGHPKAGELAKKSVEECYGSTENAWADVRVIPGRLGPWMSGYVRPGTPEENIIAARASKLSGHWLGGRLMAACSVNVPGYEVPGGESFSLAADGTVAELVASFPYCALDETEDATSGADDTEPADDEFDGFDREALLLAMEREDLLTE
jgi:hypothetical protein